MLQPFKFLALVLGVLLAVALVTTLGVGAVGIFFLAVVGLCIALLATGTSLLAGGRIAGWSRLLGAVAFVIPVPFLVFGFGVAAESPESVILWRVIYGGLIASCLMCSGWLFFEVPGPTAKENSDTHDVEPGRQGSQA